MLSALSPSDRPAAALRKNFIGISMHRLSSVCGYAAGILIILMWRYIIMNKVELIAAVADKTGLSKKDAEKALAAVLSTIETALADGDKVQLIGFGTFEVRNRAARTGRNPQTKETIKIAASKQPVFKAGQAFKNAIK